VYVHTADRSQFWTKQLQATLQHNFFKDLTPSYIRPANPSGLFTSRFPINVSPASCSLPCVLPALPIWTYTSTTERHELRSSSSNKRLQLPPLPPLYKYPPQPFLVRLQVGFKLSVTWRCVDWKISQNVSEKRRASETPLTIYQSTQRNIPGDLKLHHHPSENRKSRTHTTLFNECKQYDFRHAWNLLVFYFLSFSLFISFTITFC
jgi:hypothetical protein